MDVLEHHALTFPYPKPYSALPWEPIGQSTDLPLDTWVWVSDRLYNIYPAARTTRGLEVPPQLNLGAMVKAGVLDKPMRWLPFRPDRVEQFLHRFPIALRHMRPAHG